MIPRVCRSMIFNHASRQFFSPSIYTSARFCLSITVPTIAESISSGTVANWSKKVGDAVREDEVICQIESDKLTVDIRAPASGVITAIRFEDGAQVDVGTEISTMRKGDAPDNTNAHATPSSNTTANQTVSAPPQAAAPAKPQVSTQPAQQVDKTSQPEGANADSRSKSVRLSMMRKRIAERLKSSQNTAAMLTTFNEIDMTPIIELRNKYKDAFEKRHGVKLGFMSPFVKACAVALQEVPIVNAYFTEDAIEYHEFVDISVAVATPKGLVVPIIRDAHLLSFAEIEKKIMDFSERAKQNKLSIDEMTGGTFTISNGGTFGSWMGTPIINPPQGAILGMHATKKKPWVVNNQVVVRDIMAVALTYDHRLIDGKDAVTFLVRLKSLIEDPTKILFNLF